MPSPLAAMRPIPHCCCRATTFTSAEHDPHCRALPVMTSATEPSQPRTLLPSPPCHDIHCRATPLPCASTLPQPTTTQPTAPSFIFHASPCCLQSAPFSCLSSATTSQSNLCLPQSRPSLFTCNHLSHLRLSQSPQPPPAAIQPPLSPPHCSLSPPLFLLSLSPACNQALNHFFPSQLLPLSRKLPAVTISTLEPSLFS
ncbi:hypothetical protein AMTR_s00004p00257940 [Amborella trichopoda]|uniref:Uncharacterized protein n=1 Tax=Amborella trichopoda TaxID=13333 RepID=W1NEE5_AMBTC|nr:hypothetical protein AMTR_s00004p00257940 [Amborella trichopoda]